MSPLGRLPAFLECARLTTRIPFSIPRLWKTMLTTDFTRKAARIDDCLYCAVHVFCTHAFAVFRLQDRWHSPSGHNPSMYFSSCGNLIYSRGELLRDPN